MEAVENQYRLSRRIRRRRRRRITDASITSRTACGDRLHAASRATEFFTRRRRHRNYFRQAIIVIIIITQLMAFPWSAVEAKRLQYAVLPDGMHLQWDVVRRRLLSDAPALTMTRRHTHESLRLH